jgi:hypothetical protein
MGIYHLNLLKPTGYGLHKQVEYFNNCMLCPYCFYMFCICPRTNNNLCHLHNKLTGFYNRDEKCLRYGLGLKMKQSALRLLKVNTHPFFSFFDKCHTIVFYGYQMTSNTAIHNYTFTLKYFVHKFYMFQTMRLSSDFI